jgi:hypothetical protein
VLISKRKLTLCFRNEFPAKRNMEPRDMSWLPAIFKSKLLPITEHHELTLKEEQTKALSTIAESLSSLSQFVSNGGLTTLLSGYARSQAVKDILGGLAAHDGRNALDARVLDQNAKEISEQVEKVFQAYQEKLKSLAKDNRDPHIRDAEADFKKWKPDDK